MQKRTRVLVIRIVAVGAWLAVFIPLMWHRWFPSETTGRAVLHVYFESPEFAVLPLPIGWKARQGIDNHLQCALVMDAASRPRLNVCAHLYGSDTAGTDSVEGLARRAAALYPGEHLAIDVRQTESGPIYRVKRTFGTSATFRVVVSGTAIENRIIRRAGEKFFELNFTEDAADEANLDPIVWDSAEHATVSAHP